jgi:dTDP-4-amino-4,6-dideoxygalactose transaminase
MKSNLAVLGGEPVIDKEPADLFRWPIITQEDENAAAEVLFNRSMSNIDVTVQFEKEFCSWQKCKYALGSNNGTSAILSAMWACGIGKGDEIICPSITYWASALPVFQLRGTVVFADIDPDSLCINPTDFEKRITDKTKAVIVVHYFSHPAEMDKILEIARKYNIKVIEDFSHAQGGHYKGRKLGSWGDVGIASLMTNKSLSAGEAGILITDNKLIYERAVAFGHYERFNSDITDSSLKEYRDLPLGGVKNRMHQISAAVGRTQLKCYNARISEIQKANDYFWSKLIGFQAFMPHKIIKNTGDMAGHYLPVGHYNSEELNGLPVSIFAAAVRAEGFKECMTGCNHPLHKHPVFQTADIYNEGKPTRIVNSEKDVREGDKSLFISENIHEKLCSVPWFKHFDKEAIDKYANIYSKVLESYKKLNILTKKK